LFTSEVLDMTSHHQKMQRREKSRAGKPTGPLDGDRMNLEEQLLAEHSRRNTDLIVRWIGADAQRLAQLMNMFLGNDPLLTQRAAWVIGVFADVHPVLLEPWIDRMLRKIKEPGVHNAARRNVVRVLQFVEIPQRSLGRVAATCFEELASGTSPAAVKANAMTVLARIARREPDLARELRLIIEQQLPYGPGSFLARARKVLKEIAG